MAHYHLLNVVVIPLTDLFDTVLIIVKVDEDADCDVLWSCRCHQVEVNKLRVFSMEDDGGSLLTSSVDPQLKEAQRRVGLWMTKCLL